MGQIAYVIRIWFSEYTFIYFQYIFIHCACLESLSCRIYACIVKTENGRDKAKYIATRQSQNRDIAYHYKEWRVLNINIGLKQQNYINSAQLSCFSA